MAGLPSRVAMCCSAWTGGLKITHGPESRIVGLDFGPRYNFVQPGWKVVPFVGAMVGFGFADTQDYPNPAVPYGLGQDFNFKFSVNNRHPI